MVAKNKLHLSFGFTLVEILVVVAVVSVLMTATFPLLSDYSSSQQFNSAVDNIISLIRRSQTNSVIQRDGKTWGICLSGNTIKSYSDSCNSQTTLPPYQIPEKITVTGLDDIQFSQLRGEPSASTVITISSHRQSYYIFLDDSGGFTPIPENEVQPSIIRVVKTVTPVDSNTTVYNLSIGSNTLSSDPLTNSGTYSFTSLSPGNYLLESIPNSDYYTNISCSNGASSSGDAISISLSSGQDITCTFTHTLVTQSSTVNACIFNDLNENAVMDAGEEYFNNWEVQIDGGPWQVAENGCELFSGLTNGDHIVTERLQSSDYYNTTPLSYSVNIPTSGTNAEVKFGNKRRYLTIVIDTIICANESDLPNWGNGASNIVSSTATNFLSTHPSCHREQDWYFQWGYQNAANPGDNIIGEQTGGAWHTIGPTGSTGRAIVEVNDLNESPYLWMRMVLKPGYQLFTYGPSGNNNSNNVTGEFYCHTDVLNYDNYDMLTSPTKGNTYYCIAFNALVN